MLLRERQDLFKATALGLCELPKGAGSENLYVVHRAHEPNPLDRGKEAAVTIVVKARRVLVVKRAGTAVPTWQFPAGQVKPNVKPETIAVEEVFNETDIRCRVIEPIAERRHPDTNVYCHYFHAEWVSGEPVNRDSSENEAVEWVDPREALTRFTTDVEPAVKALLEALDRSE